MVKIPPAPPGYVPMILPPGAQLPPGAIQGHPQQLHPGAQLQGHHPQVDAHNSGGQHVMKIRLTGFFVYILFLIFV